MISLHMKFVTCCCKVRGNSTRNCKEQGGVRNEMGKESKDIHIHSLSPHQHLSRLPIDSHRKPRFALEDLMATSDNP